MPSARYDEVWARRAGGQDPSEDAVRTHLATLLASKTFPATARGRELLAYVIEQALAGHGDQLKAYNLAVSVLGRDVDFDPQGDPIVRIEVGRLRRDLEHYYLTDGSDRPAPDHHPQGPLRAGV